MSTCHVSPSRQSQSLRRPLSSQMHRASSPAASPSYRPVTPSSASSVSLGRRSQHPGASPSRLPRYDYSSAASSSSRKRSRAESSATATPHSVAYSHAGAIPSPLPLANTRYRLSGGVDTPTANTSARLESQGQQYEIPDSIPRRRWTSEVNYRPQDSYHAPSSLGALATDRNGHKRTHSSMATANPTEAQQERESWRRYVMRVAGGMAGKVWEFSSNAFVGFTSGGGTAYAMTEAAPRRITTPPRRQKWVHVEHPRDSPVPGAYPREEEESFDYAQAHHDSPRSQRPAKRLQTRQGSDWVMVDHEQVHTPAITARRPSSRASLGGTRRLSAAASRGRAARHPAMTSPSSTQQQPYIGKDDRRASFASPRSPRQSPASAAFALSSAAAPKTPPRPVTPTFEELQRLSARRERQDRQQDASMRKMNQQLKDMIRQGREALATSFEVRDDDDGDVSSYYDMDDERGMPHDRHMGDAPFDEPEDEGYSEADYEGHDGRLSSAGTRVKHAW